MSVVTQNFNLKKEIRAQNKRRKLMAEFELTKSNDEIKRVGTDIGNAVEVKKLKVVEPKSGEALTEEEYKDMKKQLAERKKLLMNIPRFNLQLSGCSASLSTKHDQRTPILMSDVQQLILYSVCGNGVTPAPTRWCCTQKFNRLLQVITVIVEGVSSHDFHMYEHLFPNITRHFQNRVEVVAPIYYGTDVTREMTCVPLTESQKQNIIEKCGTLEAAVSSREILKVFRSVFPVKQNEDIPEDCIKEDDLPPSDVFPRTYLLLSMAQQLAEGYPQPFEAEMSGKYTKFKFLKKSYKEVSVNSPMFAIDCEMCSTENSPQALTRISVVNENLEVIYETLVKPKERITNYLTKWSGITEKMLSNVTTSLKDVQRALRKLLPDDAILVGQSLNCDLLALQIFHPYVIDTSVVFNLSGLRGRKSKLSVLAEELLKENIQQGSKGHCPTEDAVTCMKLVKLKLAKGYAFGDHTATSDKHIPECELSASLFSHTQKVKKSVAIIASEGVLNAYKSVNSGENRKFYPVQADSNEDVVKELQKTASSHSFSLAHLDLSKDMNDPKENSLAALENREKCLSLLDSWCDKIFNRVSPNGLCIVVFAGPKNIPTSGTVSQPLLVNSNHNGSSGRKSKGKNSNISDSDSDNSSNCSQSSSKNVNNSTKSFVKDSSEDQKPKSEDSNKKNAPRRNGVCFIRVKAVKF